MIWISDIRIIWMNVPNSDFRIFQCYNFFKCRMVIFLVQLTDFVILACMMRILKFALRQLSKWNRKCARSWISDLRLWSHDPVIVLYFESIFLPDFCGIFVLRSSEEKMKLTFIYINIRCLDDRWYRLFQCFSILWLGIWFCRSLSRIANQNHFLPSHVWTIIWKPTTT